MKKKYTMAQIVEMNESANSCAFQAKNVLAFVLRHNMTLLAPIAAEFNTKRDEIIIKYHDSEENGVYMITDEEKLAKANEDLKQYSEVKVSLDLVVIPEKNAFDSGLSAIQLASLSWMIKSSSSDDIRTLLGITEDEEEASDEPYDPKEPVDDPRFT